MSEKRRDKKGRILKRGESQLEDGRYRYRYTDNYGHRRDIYSWRLDKNDRNPIGLKPTISLREKEKKIEADIFDQIVPDGGKLTVTQLSEKYISIKTGVRHNTEANYKTVLNLLSKEDFGQRRIDRVKTSDAKAFLIKLQKDGKGYSTVKTVRGILRPAFEMAVQDDLIRRNPFDFQLVTVVINDSITREAISIERMKTLLKFIKEDKHFSRYYEGIYILFNTGLRISEFVGLTISDIDFKNKMINVNHQLQRKRNMEYIIEATKTTSGTRQIPMNNEVCDCFRTIINNRPKVKVEPIIDGYVGFLYLDKNGMPMVALHWEKYFQHIVEKYNKIYKVQMPKVTPHICRHTFCSNMARAGMNPKTLQYIMGHSNIGVTLNTYTHVGSEDARKEMDRIDEIERTVKREMG